MACHSFPEVGAAIGSAIRASLTSRAMPVNLALAMVTDGLVPVHAAVALALATGPQAVDLAAALELMYLSVHRLHRQLDHPQRDGLGIGTAADVLVGDYLSTGAFRLLVRCGDMGVMRVIAQAVQRACEAELLACRPAALDDPADHLAAVADCAAPLGQAAGMAGALLAQGDPGILQLAGRFGRHACTAHALASHAASAIGGCHGKLAAAAESELKSMRAAANALERQAGNPGPRRLCTELALHVAALLA